MNHYIIYEKDKALAEFLAKKNIEKQLNKSYTLIKKDINEISSTSLFSFAENSSPQQSLWEEKEQIIEHTWAHLDNEHTEHTNHNESIWAQDNNVNTLVNIIHIDDKKKGERLIKSINNGELSHRLEQDNAIYCFIITIVDNDMIHIILQWAQENIVNIVSPLIIDKNSFSQLAFSLCSDYDMDKDKTKILVDKIDNNYGLIVPFLASFDDGYFTQRCYNMSVKDFSLFVDNFFPLVKKTTVFPWDWKKSFSHNDFEQFSKIILNVEKECGNVVLLRTMYTDISLWYRVSILVANGESLTSAASRTKNGKLDYYSKKALSSNLSSDDFGKMVIIVFECYNEIMSGSMNRDTLISTMIVNLWNIVSKD